jgi:hypothetical protein
MKMLIRTLRFVGFTLVEYARSGRILVELLAGVIFFYIFLRRWTTLPSPEYFFSTTSLFALALTWFALEGLLFVELFGTSPLSKAERAKLLKRLTVIADQPSG